ncbi:Polyphosphate:AMP phosphotransferase [Chthonomonas calidirosea]|uniref:Polyphosphate:AMP phosphotransferase n=1 Tax=Chthonomonas calidirosea (strain DSM 23976 / ICMP 18418 / T49) TaxID=1303518 RepID=S0ESF1_CHTCT|nr:polyphosphate--AMP phosphotransferase [Chthonomonas calidirosea]CCW34191.1 Polyphosphate:AMP phosphotransferase [Chthonomonas calidirosea T49]CEK14330.1 Polyphosphate:AMP phosphotransferase [Chthonomonas calidirosea]CEK15499.1 Polyphosphate:AMP phosphotransferase [Chthonomonas calidirosea]
MTYLKPLDGTKKIQLHDIDPSYHAGLDKEEGEKRSAELLAELAELQELLYAASTHAVLIVLQGIDTAGKDGTIRHVFSSVSPQSCRVASFKVPTPEEAAHDFLWRIHKQTPAKGSMVIFNRSHYEDVLVVRVHKLVPETVWRARYEQINAFEQLLATNGTLILKFLLHISKEEQEQRLREREKDPTKAWKLSVADWKERELWDDYQKAFEDALNHCATPFAPWYVVPSNHKWFRNLAIAEILVETLRPLRQEWLKQLEARGKEELAQIKALRKDKDAS